MKRTVRSKHQRTVFAAGALFALFALGGAAKAQPQLTTLYSFDGVGAGGPMAGLVQGADGALYGTTRLGGPAYVGTVFRFDPATRSVATLHTFTGPDGSTPFSGLAAGADGLLYGSTFAGGANDLGTLFRVGPAGGATFTTLHSFDGAGGAKPDDQALTQAADGAFYGVTSEGGTLGGGTLFRLDPVSQQVTTVHSFAASNSAGVDAGLVAGRDGSWYGTTYTGGASGGGSVFRVDPATGTPVTLHDFGGADGLYPVPGALMQGSDGNLYGTTQLGGSSYGVVYRLDPVSLAFKVLHSFSGVNDGRNPLGGVVEGGDGYLYGTTVVGGAGYGTVYRIDLTTLTYGIVVWFSGGNGRMPSGNLTLASDGALYGTTRVGGAFNSGTIYRLAAADTVPPVIGSVTASPNVLKPANGRMVPVTVTVAATDNIDPAPVNKIIGVTCNEPAAGDWSITGDLTVSLRAKRLGKTARVYTITVQSMDASGNSATATVTVTVPK